MGDPMTDVRLAKARAHVARMQDPAADLTYGDYFARDLLAEVDRLRAALAEAQRMRSTHLEEVNAAHEFLGDVLDLLPGATDEGADALDQIPRGIEKLKAERDRLAEQVKRIADEADARAAKTVQDDAYERGQATGLRAVAAAIRAALAGEGPA